MKRVLACGVWILVSSYCYSVQDDFNSSLLDLEKWGYTGSPYSDAFQKGNENITFSSNTDQSPQYGFIYWKEKMYFSNNWSARVSSSINASFITGDSNGHYGNVQTAIGIVDDVTSPYNTYLNTFLRENYPNNNPANNNFFFNPNWTINNGIEYEIKTPITADNTLLEISFNADNHILTSRTYSETSGGTPNLLQSHEFNVTQWSNVDGVYIIVGGLSVNTVTASGTATIDNFDIVPEPSALALLVVGLGGLAMMRRRRS